jgi:hypothetical protein
VRWLVFIAVVAGITAVLCYLKGRRSRRTDPEVIDDSSSGNSFYPEVEKCHAINSKSITCSCPDFRKDREQFRHDDPRRLCKHLVKSFVDARSLPEELELFRKGIELSAEDHSGFPADRRRFDRLVSGKKISLMVPKEVTEEDPWIDIYYEAGRYRYSPSNEKWADDIAPPGEAEVIRFICEKVGVAIPESILNRTVTASHIKEEGTKRREPAPHRASEGLKDAERLLREILPPDGELALKETKSYLAVTFRGSRKWICRLYLYSKKARYIEFPDGRRYAFREMKDISGYRDQLLNAYGEQRPRTGNARMLFPMGENSSATLGQTPAESHDSVRFFSQN